MAPNILKGPTDKETDEALQGKTQQEIFDLCVQYRGGDYVFQKAVDKGLLAGLDVNEILLKATKGSSFMYILKAINEDADINCRDELGASPILWAAWLNNLDVLRWLVEHGANVNDIFDDSIEPLSEDEEDQQKHWYGGCTPLTCAVMKDNLEMVQYLVENGAEIQMKDIIGYTALDWAELAKQNDIYNYLLNSCKKT